MTIVNAAEVGNNTNDTDSTSSSTEEEIHWFPQQKVTGVEPGSVVPESSNIEIPVKPCIFLSGKFEGLRVRILIDRGSNTNMIASAFVEKHREELAQNLGLKDAVISNSRMGVEERTTKA